VVAGTAVTFSGGTCSGGSGQLNASWNFGDGSQTSSSNRHTYQQAGTYWVTVTCSDASTTATSSKLSVSVSAPAVAKQGFLARTWSALSAIDPSNPSIYPVAGLSSSGVAQAVWLQNLTLNNSGAFSGSVDTNSATSWTLNGALPMDGSTASYSNYLYRTRPAPIDMAVSPNGHALAAWIAGSSLWYATKTETSNWSTPVKLSISPTEVVLKVAVSDQGNGMIAYCTASGAQAITYASGTINTTPKTISTRCWGQSGNSYVAVQITRGFDLAVDNSTSNIYAVGLMPSPTVSGNAVVTKQTFNPSTGWGSAVAISDDLPGTSLGSTVSYSISPNGQNEAVAWSGVGPGGLLNAYARISRAGVMGAVLPLQTNNSSRYGIPLIAINDNANAFAVMANVDSDPAPYMVNYSPANGWLKAPKLVASYSGYGGVDVAIDQYGNGLVTLDDDGIDTLAVTLSADGQTAKSQSIVTGYGFSNFHYQTLKALPDGRAILAVSNYSQGSDTPSGVVVLK
ncbi:MAG: PKD domain-containing protein, partial [Burkholderiales bacterium]|nr:PKD domain-containing protein [Burkholderiales bacterium]